jgi:hypothetical protein
MVRLRFKNANAFLGLYLGRIRRGHTLLFDLPDWTLPGDVLDVEITVGANEPVLLFAQVERIWGQQGELRFVRGRTTDRVVYPLLSRALCRRQANRLLAMLG